MPDHRAALGRRGEDMVAALLEERGFEILARNVRVGRLELDIVATQGPLVVICEVRTRTTAFFGTPVESIDPAKVRRVRVAAARWLGTQPELAGRRIRYDAAGVLFERGAKPSVEYYVDAF